MRHHHASIRRAATCGALVVGPRIGEGRNAGDAYRGRGIAKPSSIATP